MCFFFFFQAEDGIRDLYVTGVQTCALPISRGRASGLGWAGTIALPTGLLFRANLRSRDLTTTTLCNVGRRSAFPTTRMAAQSIRSHIAVPLAAKSPHTQGGSGAA